MASIYITTSRKPSVLTLRLAKALALILNARKENRGKKSLDEIVAKSENFGLARVLLIYESHGNPSSLNFYEDKWLEPEVKVNHYKLAYENGEKLPKTLKVESDGSEEAERVKGLFNLENDGESRLSVFFSKSNIEFKLGKKVLLTIFLTRVIIETPLIL